MHNSEISRSEYHIRFDLRHRLYLSLLLLTCLLYAAPSATVASTASETEQNQIFFPIIFTGLSDIPDIRSNPYCRWQYAENPEYTFNTQEAEIEQLLKTDPGQKRADLKLSIALSQAARRRAQDMANRAYFDHTNPDGFGPNCIVLQEKFLLPDNYGSLITDNNVETIAAGYANMTEAWKGLLTSAHHADHLLGRVDFYREQTYYGIGYVNVPGSQYQHYLVIIISDQVTE